MFIIQIKTNLISMLTESKTRTRLLTYFFRLKLYLILNL